MECLFTHTDALMVKCMHTQKQTCIYKYIWWLNREKYTYVYALNSMNGRFAFLFWNILACFYLFLFVYIRYESYVLVSVRILEDLLLLISDFLHQHNHWKSGNITSKVCLIQLNQTTSRINTNIRTYIWKYMNRGIYKYWNFMTARIS